MTLNRRTTSLGISLSVFLILTSGAFSQPAAGGKMILVGTEGVKNSDYGTFLTLVFTDAFDRMGYEFIYSGYPAARASAMSDAGLADGEISRVYEYQSAHPNLIRIEEPLYTTAFVAFAVKPGITLNGWESLKDTAYFVEYRRGVKLSRSRLSRVVEGHRLSDVSSAVQGLKKLVSGRTDLYIDVEFTIRETIKDLNPDIFDISGLYQAGIMQTVDAFAYLHKRHAALVPELTGILKTMKQEGRFDDYLKAARVPY